MEKHALAILDNKAVSWNWPHTTRIQESGKQSGKSQAVASRLLYYLIVESQTLGGTVLNQFWEQVGTCNKKLKENIESLKKEDFVSAQRSFEVLFQELDPKNVNFGPVLAMAAEFFTHLGVAFMNPRGRKSGTSTAFSVSDAVDEEVDELLQHVNKEGDYGTRKQVALKGLSFKRDGRSCLLTDRKFRPYNKKGVVPDLAHIIPNSVHGKSSTLKCIAMFAGTTATHDIVGHLNKFGNVMNMESNAHGSYDRLEWGIEAKEECGEVKYLFRMVPSPTDPNDSAPEPIILKEGGEIRFGNGENGKELGNGPIPRLCNLQLAVSRVLHMSGAADIILEWKDDADDDGCYRLFIASEEYCDMLDAKLLLSGRALVVF